MLMYFEINLLLWVHFTLKKIPQFVEPHTPWNGCDVNSLESGDTHSRDKIRTWRLMSWCPTTPLLVFVDLPKATSILITVAHKCCKKECHHWNTMINHKMTIIKGLVVALYVSLLCCGIYVRLHSRCVMHKVTKYAGSDVLRVNSFQSLCQTIKTNAANDYSKN